MEKEDKKIIYSSIAAMVIMLLSGMILGCLITHLSHRDIYRHYNECQEQQLIKTNAELRDEKSWYIKEDSFGKLKIVQMSNRELDSLSK